MNHEQINEAVAQKLGWTALEWAAATGGGRELIGKRPGDADELNRVPDYAISIEAAWDVVAHLSHHWFLVKVSESENRAYCAISRKGGEGLAYANEETAPRAICRAFLDLP